MRNTTTKYSDAVAERIVAALELGATLTLAAQAGGISIDTLGRWRKRYPDFNARIEAALASAAIACLQRIRAAAEQGQWQAAAWLLERRYPDQWGRRAPLPEPTSPMVVRVVVDDDAAL